MSWVGWAVTGSAIAMVALITAGLVIAVVRGILLKRRVSATSRTVSPLVEGISAGLSDIERGVARAEAGAAALSRDIEDLRVSVAELQVIGHHAALAFGHIRGPLGWVAGVRSLIKYRGR
jgi:hypothetical protein